MVVGHRISKVLHIPLEGSLGLQTELWQQAAGCNVDRVCGRCGGKLCLDYPRTVGNGRRFGLALGCYRKVQRLGTLQVLARYRADPLA